jgi:hypothetical protein
MQPQQQPETPPQALYVAVTEMLVAFFKGILFLVLVVPASLLFYVVMMVRIVFFWSAEDKRKFINGP